MQSGLDIKIKQVFDFIDKKFLINLYFITTNQPIINYT